MNDRGAKRMIQYTPYQARYFAEQIDLKRSQSSMEGLASTMSGVKVDLNPHQVEAALFACCSPLSSGACLLMRLVWEKRLRQALSWLNIGRSVSGVFC